MILMIMLFNFLLRFNEGQFGRNKNIMFIKYGETRGISLRNNLKQITNCTLDWECMAIENGGNPCSKHCVIPTLVKDPLPASVTCNRLKKDFAIETNSITIGIIQNFMSYNVRSWTNFKCGYHSSYNDFYLGNEFLYNFMMEKHINALIIRTDVNILCEFQKPYLLNEENLYELKAIMKLCTAEELEYGRFLTGNGELTCNSGQYPAFWLHLCVEETLKIIITFD
ncbi:hypothetical protein SNEBB_004132 [Seison nebaliae]|nr:hypothetical protein SNEBB_004132 [Seison nebaliae]